MYDLFMFYLYIMCILFYRMVDRFSARPEYASLNFTLMTTFPNKDLVDETLDLTAAGLLNAVLVLKLNK